MRSALADVDGRLQHAANGHGLQHDILGVFSLFDFRETEQVFDDGVQAVGLLGNDAQESLGVDWVLAGAVEQRFDEALDGGDGSFEFVGDVGHEIAANVLQPTKIRNVVQHDDGADGAAFRIVQRRAVRLHHALTVSQQNDVGLDRLAASQRPADEAAQVGVAHHFAERAALGLREVDRQQPRRGGVHADDVFVAVDGQHAFGHAGQHGLLFVVVLNQYADLVLYPGGHIVESIGQFGEFARVGHGRAGAHWPLPSRSAALPTESSGSAIHRAARAANKVARAVESSPPINSQACRRETALSRSVRRLDR